MDNNLEDDININQIESEYNRLDEKINTIN